MGHRPPLYWALHSAVLSLRYFWAHELGNEHQSDVLGAAKAVVELAALGQVRAGVGALSAVHGHEVTVLRGVVVRVVLDAGRGLHNGHLVEHDVLHVVLAVALDRLLVHVDALGLHVHKRTLNGRHVDGVQVIHVLLVRGGAVLGQPLAHLRVPNGSVTLNSGLDDLDRLHVPATAIVVVVVVVVVVVRGRSRNNARDGTGVRRSRSLAALQPAGATVVTGPGERTAPTLAGADRAASVRGGAMSIANVEDDEVEEPTTPEMAPVFDVAVPLPLFSQQVPPL
ncbi:hypothetical protein ON010_g19085 [Phytophthora cinnamomi]|nr:hypothetical protein ON010_g19085 [Phytophthora cinnamomi]